MCDCTSKHRIILTASVVVSYVGDLDIAADSPVTGAAVVGVNVGRSVTAGDLVGAGRIGLIRWKW